MQWNPLPETSFWTMDVWVLCGLLFYAWMVQRHVRKIGVLFQALFDFRDFDKPLRASFRDGDEPGMGADLMFFIVSLTTYSWLLYHLADLGWIPGAEAFGTQGLMLSSMTLLTACYLFKFLVLRLVSVVFEEKKFAPFVVRMGLYYDTAFSFVALPVLAFSLHLEEVWIKAVIALLFVLFCIVFLVKVLRFVVEGKNYTRFSQLHIFVYLCALEILPVICFWRIFCILWP